MPEQFRVHDRTVTYLDSAPWPQGIAQHVAPAGAPDAGRPVGTENVVVLLHAFPLNADMWEAQLDGAAPGWRYLAPDLRGFGRSDPEDDAPPEPSMTDYARDVLALLDNLGVRRAIVAGLSMGGYAAFAFVRLAPQRVRGLVLANTRAEADSEQARQGRLQMLDLLDRDGVEAVAEQMLPRLLGDTTRRERGAVLERVRTIARSNSAGGIRNAIRRMMSRDDSTPLLGTLRCPTLLVASDEDVITPADGMRWMKRRIDGAELEIIRGAGHLSNVEQPRDFNTIVQGFLTTRFGG